MASSVCLSASTWRASLSAARAQLKWSVATSAAWHEAAPASSSACDAGASARRRPTAEGRER
eukprot:6197566-Pleurochrysis_carterae.AAC.2